MARPTLTNPIEDSLVGHNTFRPVDHGRRLEHSDTGTADGLAHHKFEEPFSPDDTEHARNLSDASASESGFDGTCEADADCCEDERHSHETRAYFPPSQALKA